MFTQEYDVKGNIIKGNITGNWSKNSQHVFKIRELNPQKLDENDLIALVDELTLIRDKVIQLNIQYKNNQLK